MLLATPYLPEVGGFIKHLGNPLMTSILFISMHFVQQSINGVSAASWASAVWGKNEENLKLLESQLVI